jgi:hypothetical protein
VTDSERPLVTGSGSSATLRVAVEALRVRAEALAATVDELIDEGSMRRITVRNGAGHAVLVIPLSAGVVATLVAPAVVAVATFAALAGSWTIEVDRLPGDAIATA